MQLQEFCENEEKVFVVNLPPRHGKSRTVGLLVEWLLGRNNKAKIMTGSYNKTLSTSLSKQVRDNIQEVKAALYKPVYPGVNIKTGDAAMNLWSLEDGYNNYLATSPDGTATGFGCDLMIIDDLIKNSEEAYNENVLEKHWDWFRNTMLSRLEEGGKIIIVMTRWATEDLSGRVLRHYAEQDIKTRHITMRAFRDDESMLCSEILSHNSYKEKIAAMGLDIAEANYQQNPIDIKGRLYSSFKIYTELPKDINGNLLFTQIKNYTDTADEGNDYLCSINYGIYNKEAYILNILYTKAPMEITEIATAKLMLDDEVGVADIESNNGGRSFARAVERILRKDYKSNKTVVRWFHQSKNKTARILTNAPWIINHVYFPVNWKDKYPDYYQAMSKYQREGKNKHDDAPDATTGIAEMINEAKILRTISGLNV